MNTRILFILFAVIFSISVKAQNITQTVRGIVTDKDTHAPLPGVNVIITSSLSMLGASSDANGEFRITNVPIGKHDIKATFIGYKEQFLSNIEVISGKETVLTILIEESVTTLSEIDVKAFRNKTLGINEMSSISSRTFSVEETGRYAGSRNDVSRMASNYAGVANGDDSRNDIVIRGNSPMGLLWKLDEIEIPSPNHFTSVGSSGGPVSMLNYNMISNSDFMTGAFPAEYGNATSGVFDIKLRTGNNSKREYMLQAGALGTEVMLEGPFSRNYKGSYLINYRFSTTSILSMMGINFGYAGKADYQDLAYNFNLPISKKITLNFFGMGGKSIYKVMYKDRKEVDFNTEYINSDSYYQSGTYVAASSLIWRLTDNTYWKTVAGFTDMEENGKEDSVALDFSNTFPNYKANNFQKKLILSSYIKTKINAKNKIKTGISVDKNIYEMKTKFRQKGTDFLADQRIGSGSANFLQMYAQWSHSFTEKITMNSGIHYQYLGLNNDQIIEPRWGIKWDIKPNQILSFGYGLHSQMQTLPLYMVATPVGNNTINTNKSLKFSKSNQFVAGYNLRLTQNTVIKTEVYYQHLFDLPIERNTTPTSFSAVNEGLSYIFTDNDSLVNQGIGRNYGLELTLERFFSNSFYYLITTSLYDSKYKGSDGVLRNTAFNGKFVFNALAGKEFKINEKSKILIDLKLTTAGGRRYTPVNFEESKVVGFEVKYNDLAYSKKFGNYFRTDLKLTYRFNKNGSAQEIFINIDSLFNTKNIFSQIYNQNTNEMTNIYQLGIFPTFQYKLYF